MNAAKLNVKPETVSIYGGASPFPPIPSPVIYLIGALKNQSIPGYGVALRELGYDVFDDWFAPGKNADVYWKKYSQARGQTYKEALNSWAAKHIFAFDKHHLDRADIGVLVMPAGKSGHLELGYLTGKDKSTFILWPDGEPPKDKWDIMVKFATPVFSFSELVEKLNAI